MSWSGRAKPLRFYDKGPIKNEKYPAVIILKSYISKRKFTIPCNRKNVFWRDNYICQYCENKFLRHCKKTGGNGLIGVDLPWPENVCFAKKCKKKSINFVQLLSPTTSKERLKKIVKDSHDMIYYISMLSTTGGKLKVSPKKILNNYKKIKKICGKKNCVIGFGITDKTISKLKTIILGDFLKIDLKILLKRKSGIRKNS